MTFIKERIVSNISSKGPSLPVQIARAISTSPLFASAFLSELYGEKRLKMSNMKVGSSPLYYVDGQEPLLENFVQHLNHKEKEAFHILKKEKLLDDEVQAPAIRVALRYIPDFAVPIKIILNGETKNFWKYFLLPDTEIKSVLEGKEPVMPQSAPLTYQTTKLQPLTDVPKSIMDETEKQLEKQYQESVPKVVPVQTVPVEKPVPKKEIEKEIERVIEKKEEKPKKEKKKKSLVEDTAFGHKVKNHLSSKNIELLSTILEKKKDFIGKVHLDTPFGKQEYYLVAKDKKKLSEEDLIVALQKAQENKMPALLLNPGEIDKEALSYLESWRNFLKHEKLK